MQSTSGRVGIFHIPNVWRVDDSSLAISNKPFTRAKAVEEVLSRCPQWEMVPFQEADNRMVVEFVSRGNLVHTGRYMEFLRCAYPSFAALPVKDPDYGGDNGLTPYNFVRCPNQSAVKLDNVPYWKQAGFFGCDRETPIQKHTHEVAIASAANSIVAAKALLSSKFTTAYALNIFPGHHADREQYGGYCFLNNAALAADYFSFYSKKERTFVCILDIDYHHGDGTEKIFRGSADDVITLSVHMDPMIDFPTFTGQACEDVIEKAYNYTVQPGATWKEYREQLARALKVVQQVKPELLIVAFGGDTFVDDKDSSILARTNANTTGGMKLQLWDYQTMGEEISKAVSKETPILVTQEGGYSMENMGWIVKNFLLGLTKCR